MRFNNSYLLIVLSLIFSQTTFANIDATEEIIENNHNNEKLLSNTNETEWTFENPDKNGSNDFFDENAEYFIIDGNGNYFPLHGNEELALAQAEKLAVVKKSKKKRTRNCKVQSGKASWYGPGFEGKKTASGERFSANALTAAHKTLKFNSIVRVTYHGRSAEVRINDNGPFSEGRVIDLSKAAAKEIGLLANGHGQVELEILRCGNSMPPLESSPRPRPRPPYSDPAYRGPF